jgi:CRISPR-associated endonuclease Csn1
LWEEQGGQSIYSLLPVEASEIAGCEIEHLIPQSQGGTSSYMNLALIHANENFGKGDLFPYEFLKPHVEKFQDRDKILAANKYPKSKAWRFSRDARDKYFAEGDEEQTDHRLNDTSYMAKLSARYLSLLCPDVVAVKGGTTAFLRHLWGLDGLEYELAGLPVHKDIINLETGEVQIDPSTGYPAHNPSWKPKPRIDHRHHALDALVAACTSRQMVKNIVLAEKQGKRKPDIVLPFGKNEADFRQQVLQAIQTIVVSPKLEHGKAGQLHDATKYRILNRGEGDRCRIRYRRSLDKIKTKQDVNGISFKTKTIPLDSDAIRAAFEQCQHIRQTIEQFYAKAEAILAADDEENRLAGKRVSSRNDKVQEQAVVRKAISLAQKEKLIGETYPKPDNKRLVAINEQLQFGFEPKNNYCMDFYEYDGEVAWECITRIAANTTGFEPQWKKDGGKLIWSLHNSDVVEVVLSEELKTKLKAPCPVGKQFFVVQMMRDRGMQFNLLEDARPKGEGCEARWTTDEVGLLTIRKLLARKVELTPFGKIHRKHKKLWNGKKIS